MRIFDDKTAIFLSDKTDREKPSGSGPLIPELFHLYQVHFINMLLHKIFQKFGYNGKYP